MMFKKNQNLCKMIPFLYLFLLIFLITFSAAPAFAHKVTIFAWVEGNTIYTQSKFSGGKKAKGALVTVFDMEGNRLLEGTTDEKGKFSFKIPKKTGLKVVLKASMGHTAEWKIPVEEIAAAQSSQNKTSEAGVITDTTSPSNRAPTFGPTCVQREEIRRLIDESLDQKLGPIISMLADSHDQDPGISEVMGGIGYIFGLLGVALYFANRRKNKEVRGRSKD
jgi:nickel transport protein